MFRFLADGEGEALFWIILAVIYMLVQLISRGAKQPTPKTRPRERPPRPPPPRLQEIMRALGAEPPLAAPEAEPVVTRVRRKKRPAPSPVEEPLVLERPPEPAVVSPQEPMRMPRMRSLLVIPRLPVTSLRSLSLGRLPLGGTLIPIRGRPVISLRHRETLRRAMLARFILEPPRGLRL